MKSGITLLAVVIAATSVASCVTKKRGASDYGDYPDIKLLQQSQAEQIRWSPTGQIHGRIEQSDWDAIMAILSRIPTLNDSQRELVNVVCYGDPTIAVEIQLGYGTQIQFVKTGRFTWIIAGFYYFDP